jgi:glycosyltransferase involved in cell wall biosynthesis
MKISFVVPAYNEQALLARSLNAIRDEILRAGQELGKDAEIIVVNNASTDRTREVALSIPGVTVVDEPRKGLVQARWCGFEHSTGELIANIDADTIIPPAGSPRSCASSRAARPWLPSPAPTSITVCQTA